MYPSLLSLIFTLPLLDRSLALAKPNHPVHARRSSSNVEVNVPLHAPQSAPQLERDLVSLSIEGDRFAEWVGIDAPNEFFLNTLHNLIGITGVPPVIRVGANSEDKTFLVNNVNVVQSTFPAWTTTTPYPEASQNLVTSAYFALSKRLPQGTHMIWGVNFGANNITNAVAEAKAIRSAFSVGGAASRAGITLDAIEIGNEADLYAHNGQRSSSWSIDQYIPQWESFANAIISGANLNEPGAPSLILAAFGFSSGDAAGFSPQNLFKQGVTSGPLKKHFKYLSQHHYSGSFCSGSGELLQALMAKSGIRSNITSFDSDIQATLDQGLTYLFGETNSFSCHGAPGVSNSAGAAIWALDYVLQAATRRIQRVHFHDGIGFKYNLIQPVTLDRSITTGQTLSSPLAPHVQPQYYAAIIAATLVSSQPYGSIQTTITELNITESTGNIGGYAAFDDGKLARAVLINSNAWLSGTSGSRPQATLSLSLADLGKIVLGVQTFPRRVEVRRLAIEHADDTSGVTFAGVSYETSDGLPSGHDEFDTIEIENGQFELTISSTEAVLLTFDY